MSIEEEYVDFVHLHNHSDYSLYDGLQKVDEMVNTAGELNYRAVALTDHGKVAGFIKLHNACNAYNKKNIEENPNKPPIYRKPIKPIFGLEGYLVEDLESKRSQRYHITLLAKNMDGYRNLLRLCTFAHKHTVQCFNNVFPRFDFEALQKHSDGLVVASGCIGGQVSQLLLSGKDDEALDIVNKYREVWGEDYYLEVMYTGYKDQLEVLKKIKTIGENTGIKVIATNDTHYSKKHDAKFQPLKISISRNSPIYGDEIPTPHYYLKSYKEMSMIFSRERGMDHFLSNTVEIADKCNVKLELGKAQLPGFNIPNIPEFEAFKNKQWGKNDEEAYLMFLAEKGLREKGLSENKVYIKRLRDELETIRFTGFSRYFLIVNEYCDWARSRSVRLGLGRGSGAGSLVLFCLGVTGVDPIKFDLSMDRFLYSQADYHTSASDFIDDVESGVSQ